MSIYESLPKLPGATPEEKALLKTLKAIELIKVTKVSRHMYRKFFNGEDVPEFVRIKIMQFVYDKSQSLKKISTKSNGK